MWLCVWFLSSTCTHHLGRLRCAVVHKVVLCSRHLRRQCNGDMVCLCSLAAVLIDPSDKPVLYLVLGISCIKELDGLRADLSPPNPGGYTSRTTIHECKIA